MTRIEELVEFQKKYKEIYDKSDFSVAAIDQDNIQVSLEYFLDNFINYKVTKMNDKDYPIKLITNIKGVDFLTILTMSELYELEIKKQDAYEKIMNELGDYFRSNGLLKK